MTLAHSSSPQPTTDATSSAAKPSALSATDAATPAVTDVLIIGAGPVGLFAAFEAGVLGLSCRLIDALPAAGGQCIELYPDKPIFDIPALPVCTARELVERLVEQCKPFNVPLDLAQRAVDLERREDGRFLVRTAGGMTIDAGAVLIAAGNGAFVPQRLAVDGASAYENQQVFYSVPRVEDFAGQRVLVAGGGDSALDWTLALKHVAARVTLVHRRDVFRAAPHTVDALRAAAAVDEIDLMIGTIGALREVPRAPLDDASQGLRDEHGAGQKRHGDAQLAEPAPLAVEIRQRDGNQTLEVDRLLVLYGLVADLGPMADWGFEVHAGRLVVDTHYYETTVPGIFAAGDIVTYPNKQKLILSGFHEASLALRRAYARLRPQQTRTSVHSSNDAALSRRILGESS
ncbi:MAG: NAD(P)/FAD-dependent oxidoreductase [Janthinobacterium lividum]